MRNKPSIYYQIISLFVLIGLVGAVMFSYFTYVRSSNLIENTLTSQTQESLHQISNNIEQKLISLDNLARLVASEVLIEDFVLEAINPRDPFTYREVISRLDFIAMMASPFARIDLISFNADWVIANNAFHRLPEDEVTRFRADFVDFDMSPIRSWHQLTILDGSYLAIAYPIPIYATYPTGALQVRVPIDNISNLINRVATNQERPLLILNTSMESIFHNGAASNFENADFLFEHLQPPAGGVVMEFNNTPHTMAYIRSFNYGFYYLFAVDDLVFTEMLNAVMSPTYFSSFVFFFVLVVMAFVLAKRYATPVATLSNLVTDDPRGNFKQINATVKEIIDQKNALKETVSTQQEQLKNLFISNLYQGLLNENEIHENIRRFGLPFNWKSLTVCTIQIDSTIRLFRQRESMESLLLTINEFLASVLPVESCFPPTIVDPRTQSTLMVNKDDEGLSKRELMMVFAAIQEQVKEEFGTVISVGFSGFYTDISKTRKAFKESKEALGQRLKKGQEQLIFYDFDLDVEENQQFYYPTKLTNSYFDYVKNNDQEMANCLLNQIFSEIFSKNGSLASFQLSILCFNNELFSLMRFLKIEHFSLGNKHDFLSTISEFTKPEEIEIFIKENIINVIMKTINDRKINDYQSITEEIIDIIQKEYDTDLTLEGIANRLHYHPNYLSTVFKKNFNLSFSEYLGQHRHEMAKIWLLETSLTIREISQRLQYTNSQNFIRSFKKFEAMTPGKYREQHQG